MAGLLDGMRACRGSLTSVRRAPPPAFLCRPCIRQTLPEDDDIIPCAHRHGLQRHTATQVIAFLACLSLGVVGCRDGIGEGGATHQVTGEAYTPLPDPITQRLGQEKAARIQIDGALDHLSKVADYYKGHADVVAQAGAAQSLLRNETHLGEQPPVVLFAGIWEFVYGTRIHVDALNTNRETKEVLFFYAIDRAVYEVVYETGIDEKAEEFLVAFPLRFRRASQEELSELVTKGDGKTHRILLSPQSGYVESVAVPLPDDPGVPVFVAIRDRNGRTSSAVLLRQVE